MKPYLPSKMKKLTLLVVLTVAASLAYSAPAPEAKPAAGIVCDSYRNKLIKKVLFLGGSSSIYCWKIKSVGTIVF